MRSYFVSTRAHNTVEIDGQSSKRGKEYAFGSGLRSVAPTDRSWLIEAEADRAQEGFLHRRCVFFRPHRFVLAVDHIAFAGRPTLRQRLHLAAKPKRAFTSWWHFNPNHTVALEEGDAVVAGLAGDRRLRVSHRGVGRAPPAARIHLGETSPRIQGWFSGGYLKSRPAAALGFTASSRGDYFAATLFELIGPGDAAALRLDTVRFQTRLRLTDRTAPTGQRRTFAFGSFGLIIDRSLL